MPRRSPAVFGRPLQIAIERLPPLRAGGERSGCRLARSSTRSASLAAERPPTPHAPCFVKRELSAFEGWCRAVGVGACCGVAVGRESVQDEIERVVGCCGVVGRGRPDEDVRAIVERRRKSCAADCVGAGPARAGDGHAAL